MSSISCCLNCKDRVVGCHGKCEKYQKERERNDRLNRDRMAEIDAFYKRKRRNK